METTPGISKREEWKDWWIEKTGPWVEKARVAKGRMEEWKYEVNESATATATETNWGFPDHYVKTMFLKFLEKNYWIMVYKFI